MGIIGWIKKEIESTSRQRQRRQSAPPVPTHLNRSNSTPANGNRDEAYLLAIAKFNEWRTNNQCFERLNETKNVSAITQVNTAAAATDEEFDITGVEIRDDEKEKLIAERQREKKKKSQTLVQNASSNAVYSNCNNQTDASRNKRLSLPNMQQSRRSRMFQPTSTLEEIEEFEQNHCQNVEEFSCVQNPASPPNQFFRSNSEPYAECETPKNVTQAQEKKKQTPKRLMGRGMLRRNKGKAPQPPVAIIAEKKPSESSVNFFNGNFQHYEVNSASIYDEFVISSKAYKGNLRKEQPEKINSVGESASSGSLASDPAAAADKKSQQQQEAMKQRRLSPPYQTVINKHGDEVEYALPFNEHDSMLDIPPLPTMPAPTGNSAMQFDQIIDQNFKFLNSKLDFLNSQIDDGGIKRRISSNFDPIDASFSDVRRQNLQVTDLDKSNENGLAFPAQTGDIIRDLDALTKWSQNLKSFEKTGVVPPTPLEQYKLIQNNVKVFAVNDIKYKSGALRNSFSTPLEFSNGYFHSTPITLRSTLPNLYSVSNFADLACKREFEILSQIKHSNVVSMMGISYDEDLRITSLVFEPFDFTLNHYLHQMDKFYSLHHTVSIIHQLASATRFLHECGIVHSNISSHSVLIRENPNVVKLAALELATEILPRESIGKIYHMETKNSPHNETVSFDASDLGVAERYNKLSKQHFYNRTSLPVGNRAEIEEDDENEYRLPYSIAYRRMFSMHYYQAPELLIPTYNQSARHVLPSPSSDIYGLGLLLWEAINRAVPFVIFNHDELIKGLQKGNIQLPMLDKSCIIFKDVFDVSLSIDTGRRLSDINKFITMLEDLHILNYNIDGKEKIEVLEIIEPSPPIELRKTQKNIKNADQKSKLRDKEIYFSTNQQIDPQQRFENALTAENLHKMEIRDFSKASESVLSSEIEPNMLPSSQQPGILQDDALERIRKTVEDQNMRATTPKKPNRKRDEPEEQEMSKNSTMFQSFFDFNRLHTPKVDKDVIYERTSTLKRMKASEKKEERKSVKGLFENQFQKMNDELDQIQYNKDDFMREIVETIRERRNNDDFSSFLNKGVQHEQSLSFEELPATQKESKIPTPPPMQRSENNLNYRFSLDEEFSPLPTTPIARQNKLRRNAWLSEGRATNRVSEDISRQTIDQFNQKNVSVNNSANGRKKYNVNIKIHHNDLVNSSANNSTPKDKSTNVLSQNNSSHVHIKLYNSTTKESPIVKINNVDLNRTSYAEDINKKYYPNMPELLSDVFQNKRGDRSMILSPNDNHDDESGVELRQHEENDDHVIIPIRSSVRETIKYIEEAFKPQTIDFRGTTKAVTYNSEEFSPPVLRNNETQTEFIEMPNYEPKIDDDGVDCLNKASEAIQKLEKEIPQRLKGFATPTPKKITTKLTLNVQKFTGRASDVGHMKQVQEQTRHSICNNAEIINRIQMHFQSKDGEKRNELVSTSCSSLISAKENGAGDCCNGELKKKNKYFCRNCGFTMIPSEIMQKLHGSSRFSIASSDNLQTIRYDESLQSIAALRKCRPSSVARSTEDLYIDDDFCQGISQSLGANMELLPPPEFFDMFGLNIFSAEFLHTQEHDFDDTLTDGEKNMKQIECYRNGFDEKNFGDHEEAELCEIDGNCDEIQNDKVPICDEKEVEPKND